MKDRKSNARRMSGLLEKWRGSGRTLSAFAREQGVTRDKLEYWRRRLGGTPRRTKRRSRAGQEVAFAPVEIVSTSTPVAAMEVSFPGGVRLAIDRGATPELLAAVIGALRREC
jgi:hypothetical protein